MPTYMETTVGGPQRSRRPLKELPLIPFGSVLEAAERIKKKQNRIAFPNGKKEAAIFPSLGDLKGANEQLLKQTLKSALDTPRSYLG